MKKLFKVGKYSREETICGNTVFIIKDNLLKHEESVHAENVPLLDTIMKIMWDIM